MLSRREIFESKWVGVSFAFRPEEIDCLIERLKDLKSGKTGHFHFRTDDFSKEPGVADIELSMMGDEELDNMTIE